MQRSAPASDDLRAWVETARFGPDVIEAVARAIHRDTLAGSPSLDEANFLRIRAADLARLFDDYDRRVFDGRIQATLADSPLRFRLSSRLTRAAGKTARYDHGHGGSGVSYEISVSTTLLFQVFRRRRPPADLGDRSPVRRSPRGAANG